MLSRDTLPEAAERTPLEVSSVTPERGAKDNRGGFLRQAEQEAFLKVFQKRLLASLVRRFSHVTRFLARSQINFMRKFFALFAEPFADPTDTKTNSCVPRNTPSI
jgi:hypothetical protein